MVVCTDSVVNLYLISLYIYRIGRYMQPFVDQRLIVNLAVNFVNTSILDSLYNTIVMWVLRAGLLGL